MDSSVPTPALLPSPPSGNVVAQLQIALNNLYGQLREVLVFIPEFAPAIDSSGNVLPPTEADKAAAALAPKPLDAPEQNEHDSKEDRRLLIRDEVLMRSQRIAILFDSIDTLSKKLPSAQDAKVAHDEKSKKLKEELDYWENVNKTLSKSFQEHSKVLDSFLASLDDSIESISQQTLNS